MHQHLKSREEEGINRSIRDTQKTRGRTGTLDGNRQETGQLSIPKTEPVLNCLPSLRPRVSDNHGHSRFLECVPWKFRQVRYLWKINCFLFPGTAITKVQPPTHTHTPHLKPGSPSHAVLTPSLFV